MNNIEIGSSVSMTKTFTQEEVEKFAALSGDTNPVHLDPQFAAKTIFKYPIVHGLLSSSLFSALLGTKLPGPGTIYLSQEIKFLKPVYIGEKISAKIEVISKKDTKPIYTFATTCHNEKNELVIDGKAVILLEKIS